MIIKNTFTKRYDYKLGDVSSEMLEYELYDSFILRLKKYVPLIVTKTPPTLQEPKQSITVEGGFVALNREDYQEVKLLLGEMLNDPKRETYDQIIAIMEKPTF